ncbi:MAG TPA: hypothetical protein DCL35_05615 [Candidatus Omnitrophica bacterium]|nr:hypothetical protein [Candidatus Omnitrophota bacterium]
MSDLNLKSFSGEMIRIMPSVIRGMLKKQTDEIARGHITMPQYLVLDLIDKSGPLKMTQIAREMDASLPAMSGIVERLHILKMVERFYDRRDRRIVKIGLTVKGKKVVKKITHQREKMVESVFGRLTEKERQAYLKIFKKVRDILYEKI